MSVTYFQLTTMNNPTLKTKKSKSFINEEIELLQELVLKYQDILLKKKSDSYTVASKQKVWRKIESKFNAQALFTNVSNII